MRVEPKDQQVFTVPGKQIRDWSKICTAVTTQIPYAGGLFLFQYSTYSHNLFKDFIIIIDSIPAVH